MKNFETWMKSGKKAVSSLFLLLAMGATPLCAQIFTATLGSLVSNNGSLTIGDKTFSDFGFVDSNLSTDPSNLVVTASISNGIYDLSFTGLTAVNNLAGTTSVLGDLELSYTVTANPGLISSIDQNFTPNALPVTGNQIIVGETVQNDGGEIVGNSTLSLSPSDLSDPSPEAGDNLNLSGGPYPQLMVVTDTLIAAAPGQVVGLSRLQQSFHQVAAPEPSELLLVGLGLGLLWFFKIRNARDQARA